MAQKLRNGTLAKKKALAQWLEPRKINKYLMF